MTRQITIPRVLYILFLASGFVGIVLNATIAGANDIRVEHVQFPKGEIGTTIKGSITGREIVDYRLSARASQSMVVNLETDNPSNYFNILAPGESDVAFFIGSMKGNRFKGHLPESGDFTIRVYLMRNAARRSEIANYSLEVAIAAEDDVSSEAGGTSDANSSEGDVLVAGTNFNATGEIPCARQKGQPMRSCRFGVIRRGNGSATVRIFWPDNGERNLYFENGKVSSSDAESGEGVSSEREGDLNKVFIGTEERFEIPDAVIYGG